MPRCNAGASIFRLPTAGFSFALALALTGFPAGAQETATAPSDKAAPTNQTDLKALEAEIRSQRDRVEALKTEAANLAAKESKLRRQLVDAAAKVQESEQQLSEVEERLFSFNEQENAILDRLNERRAAIADLVGAIEMLALSRPPALGVNPDDAAKAARSAMLLNDLIPQVRAKADDLERELKALSGVREGIQSEQHEKIATARSLETEREALEKLVTRMASRRARVMETAATEADRLQTLASQAKDLKGFLRTLARQGLTAVPRPKPVPGDTRIGFAALRGKLRPPVAGDVTQAFGKTTPKGSQSQGLVFTTRRAAQVVSPCDGDVLFSGQFMSYGLLLIIGTDDGYHFVLSGMSRVDVIAGQRLLAGEPVGVMGEIGPPAGTSGLPELYVELRRHGEPVDPLPWLAIADKKVSG